MEDGTPQTVIKKLGKFEVIEKVGQGAMGVVYKGRDPGIGRIVALKTLTSGFAEDPNLLRRFYTEAQSAGGMQHPNIVTIYDLGQEGSTPFIAMQFLSGESLDKKIERRVRLPLSQKIGFIVHVCRALEYAHKQIPPVVHRDIKPGNVMVTDEGVVVVVDFGIARLGEGTRSQSSGMLIGTLGYMSPQLFRNSAADARSDIWATGVMFYELLAYRRPFEGDNAAALMSSIILEKPRSLSEAAPTTPPDVQAVVDRMLAKEIESRYQTMEEVLLELEPIWQRLRQLDVSELLADSQELFAAGDLENAKAKVTQIRQIDPSNATAKTLAEKINAETRRLHLVPQLKVRLEKAERLLAIGQVEDAKVEVEAVLGLDSTFLPARELRSQVQAAEERARKITQALRDAKQSMAEGALTEAQLHLDKVLELDPGNAAARDQLRLIKEERLRRERRKQRDETLHRARTLWTNLQYEECIKLLGEALKQFPNDAEFSKLLESARQDQAEQHRQFLLTEARSHLSSQRLDEALRTLDRLLERFPNDPTAKNLRTHTLQGRDQQIREQRLTEAKAMLRSWVKEARYEDVIKHAAQLSREFSDDFELAELMDFARTELSHLEQKRRLEQFSKRVQQALKEGRFSEARLAAEKALAEFPGNFELQNLLDQSRKEQAEKERHEALKQRLREVKGLIDRQELTDAIRVGNETLRVFGPDAHIADTVLKAEKELEFREKKKLQQDEAIQQARTLVDAAKITEATSILDFAINTQLLRSDDPRVSQLLREIDAQKRPPSAAAAAAGAAAPSPALRPGSPASSKPSSDAGKDYVYQPRTALPPDLVSPKPDVAPSALSPTIITGPSSPSTQPIPLPPPTVHPPVPKKTKEKKRQQEDPRHAGTAGGTRETVFPLEGTITERPSSVEVRQAAVSPADIFEHEVEELPAPRPRPSPRPVWKSPLVLSGIAAALLIAIGTTLYVLSHGQQNGQGVAPRPAERHQSSEGVTPGGSPPSEKAPGAAATLPADATNGNAGKPPQPNVARNPGSVKGSGAVGPIQSPAKPPGPPTTTTTTTTPTVAQESPASLTPAIKPTVSTQPKEQTTAPDIGGPSLPAAGPIATSSANPSAPTTKPIEKQPPVDTTAADKAEIQQLFAALSRAFENRNVADLGTLLAHVDKGTRDPYQRAFENKELKSVTRKYTVTNSEITITGETATASGVWIGAGFRKDKPVLDARETWKYSLRKVDGHWVLTSLK